MATISNIVVKIAANTKKLASGLSKASRMVENFAKRAAKAVAVIGTTIAAGVTAAFAILSNTIVNTSNRLDRMIKTADNLGITVESFQRLAFQAGQSGIRTEELTIAMRQLLRVTGEAAMGSKRAVEAFSSLGISLSSIKNLSPDQLFLRVGKALNNMSGRAEQADTANRLFGRNWLSILNLVRSDLDKTGAQFDRLNLKITQGQRKQIEGFNDARVRVGKLAESFKNKLTAQSAKAFKVMVEGVENIILEFGNLDKIADSASKFVVNGVLNIADAIIFTIDQVSALTDAFKQLSSGNFGRKIALGFSIAQKKLMEIAGTNMRDTFDFSTGQPIKVESDRYKILKKTISLLATDIVKTDDKIANSSKKRREELDKFRKAVVSVRKEIASTQTDSFIQPIGDAFGDQKSLISDKALRTLQEEQDKRNKKTDQWKEKLKKANEELKKSRELVQTLQKAQESLVQSATFGGAVDALSKLTTQASGAQRGTGEREGLQRLLTAGFNKFQQFDPMNLTGQGQQKIEVTITTDEAGIITPVVKSQQLNDQVVTVVTKTINQQARVNDR